MDQIQKISIDIANYILDEKVIDKKELAKKIEVQIKLAMNHHNFAGGPQLRKLVEKHQKMVYSIEKEKFESKYWRDELRNIISEDDMQNHYTKMYELRKKIEEQYGG